MQDRPTQPIATCRDCHNTVSVNALHCPHCGAPRPADAGWNGWGYEYRSRAEILGWPLLHVSFKFRPNYVPVPARGWIAIGQFAGGFVTISQVGIGFLSLSQFTIAGYAVAQVGFAYELIAQAGVYVERGMGQAVIQLSKLLSKLAA